MERRRGEGGDSQANGSPPASAGRCRAWRRPSAAAACGCARCSCILPYPLPSAVLPAAASRRGRPARPQASHVCVEAMAAAAVPSAAVARAEDALSGSRAPSAVAVCSGAAVSLHAL